MAFSLSIRMLPETCRSLAFGGIGAGYVAVGTPLDNPARIILIQNLTDADLMFSLDGVHDHFPLGTITAFVLDIAANKTKSEGFFLAEGESLYVKRIGVPASGSVYFTSFYGKVD